MQRRTRQGKSRCSRVLFPRRDRIKGLDESAKTNARRETASFGSLCSEISEPKDA